MQKSRVWTRLFVTFGVAVGIPVLIVSIPGYSQSVKALQNEDEEMRRTMVTISRQLGVDCTTCHNTKNFASAEKVSFKIAKEHMKLTQLLIDNGFDGKDKHPKADCYMCHRGTLHPKYKEPFDAMTMEKEKPKLPTSTEDGSAE